VWLYQNSQTKKLTGWDLIGKDAVMVFEINKISSFVQKLDQLPGLKEYATSSNSLKQLLKNQHLLQAKTHIAIYPSASDDFEFLIYSEAGNETPLAFISDLGTYLPKGTTEKKRLYNGIEIRDFLGGTTPVLSVAVVEGILVISKSSFLVEGAVRLRNANEDQLFRTKNLSLFKLPTVQQDEGNIYINSENLVKLTALFLDKDNKIRDDMIIGGGLADLKIHENGILINGFVLSDDGDVLSLFDDQTPQKIEIQSIVSNKVSSMVHFGLSDANRWFQNQQAYLGERNLKVRDSLQQEMRNLSINLESIEKSIGNQLAIGYLNKDEGSVCILKLKEGTSTTIYDELASKLSASKNDSVYVENYAGYEIKLIDYKNFLYQLLYPLLEKTNQSFFVRIENTILFAENVELIKSFIDDIDSENTWGKSVEWNKFFGASLQESTINFFVDGKLSSLAWRTIFNKKWMAWLDTTRLLSMDKSSLQLSRLESNYYLNASFSFSDVDKSQPKKRLEKISFDFGNPLISSAQPVKSHLSRDIELLVQDSLLNIYLLSKDLRILWKEKTDAKWIDEIEQVDFFSNGKLQYLYSTSNRLYIVDRLGRPIENFPVTLPTSAPIEFSRIVDYDKSRRYRYLLSDQKGSLYLTDKSGKLLEGWNPLPLNGKLFAEARHYRILGKDYFIAIQQNGTVHLFNRRGERLRGFPLSLGIRPMGDFALTLTSSLRSSHFTVVSDEGIMLQFGLDGQIVKREVLLKRAASSRFYLINANDESAHVMMRIDPSTIAILDAKGTLIFETENQGSMNWQMTFLENRLKQRYYCLYDAQQSFSYVFDAAGKSLLTQPMESTQLPALHYDERQKTLSVYNVYNSVLSQLSIKN